MITFRLIDGTEYKIAPGRESEVIERIRSEMMRDPGSNAKYMASISNLLAELFGVWVNTDNEKRFLEALVELKVVDKVEDK